MVCAVEGRPFRASARLWHGRPDPWERGRLDWESGHFNGEEAGMPACVQ